MVLVGILGGLINSAVMLLCILFWDWRIGLLALAGMLVYQAAQDTNQYHRAGALHLVQNGGGDAGELSQTLVVEIAHGDPLEFVADGDTLDVYKRQALPVLYL